MEVPFGEPGGLVTRTAPAPLAVAVPGLLVPLDTESAAWGRSVIDSRLLALCGRLADGVDVRVPAPAANICWKEVRSCFLLSCVGLNGETGRTAVAMAFLSDPRGGTTGNRSLAT